MREMERAYQHLKLPGLATGECGETPEKLSGV